MNDANHKLQTITENPLNAETPLAGLESDITPADLVYIRNHFDIPIIDINRWELAVTGAVQNPSHWAMGDLQALPGAGETMTLECAGNGRSGMAPSPPGTPWGFGAVSFVKCRGTPLANVLEQAGISSKVDEVLFIAEDQGEVMPGRTEVFARSLPLDVALDPRTLLVWEMNGRPLSPEHGYPLRVMVPAWYGMASVKWLKEIRLISEPFTGFFQAEHYVYQKDATEPDGEPVSRIRTRSLITHPSDRATLSLGEVEIRGAAWTGAGVISQVVISTNGGESWQEAEMDPPDSNYSGRHWFYRWTPESSGNFVILSRATDSDGNTQPLNYLWNSLGYGNNGVRPVNVTVI